MIVVVVVILYIHDMHCASISNLSAIIFIERLDLRKVFVKILMKEVKVDRFVSRSQKECEIFNFIFWKVRGEFKSTVNTTVSIDVEGEETPRHSG